MTQRDPAVFAAALLHARSQGRQAMQQLAEEHLPLVAAMVRRFPHHGQEPEELYQQGCIGLMKALLRYDPARGVAFSTYAAAMILGEMRMLCRQAQAVHVPRPDREIKLRIRRAADLLRSSSGREPTIPEIAALLRMDPCELTLLMEDVTVTSIDAMTDAGTPIGDMLRDEDDWLARVEMRDAFSRLAYRDRALMHLRCAEGLTQQETANRLHMTQMQVSRREQVIRRMLRDLLAE